MIIDLIKGNAGGIGNIRFGSVAEEYSIIDPAGVKP